MKVKGKAQRIIRTALKLSALAGLTAGAGAAHAKQSLQDAIQMNPDIGVMVEAIEKSAKVECLTVDSSMSRSKMGPEGKSAITQQAHCYDPEAFNPDHLGQLTVTYYGEAEGPRSKAGAVVKIDFEVYK